jgi:TRAP-type mannitol/chloroaromatic compound transport system permease small subunit
MLSKLISAIDALNERIGNATAWVAVTMVLVQFTVVIMRYVFSFGSIRMQESIWYMHGILFMVGAGYTLLRDGHVRVDVIYREAGPRFKALVDILGAFILLLPLCLLTLLLSDSYVINAWKVFEGSTDEGGLPLIFAYKTVILVFAGLLGLQGISMAAKAWMFLSGQAGAYPPGAETDTPPADGEGV